MLKVQFGLCAVRFFRITIFLCDSKLGREHYKQL